MHFEDIGTLEYLPVERYVTEPWNFLGTAIGDDGKRWAIVIAEDGDIRYTDI